MKLWLSVLLLVPTFLQTSGTAPEGLYVWNVGQGSWATHVTASTCLHFDMGGEFSPFERIAKLCSLKKNILFLSHWDWDHFSFLMRFYRRNPNLCIAFQPELDRKISDWKLKYSDRLTVCTELATDVKRIYSGHKLAKVHKQNALSQVFLDLKTRTLFPGDSTRSEEKFWDLSEVLQLRILILGHHGSLTSTSVKLLDRLVRPRMTVASARYKRYRHPHFKVQALLRKRQLPLLRTEVWGNLVFLSR